MGPRIRRGSLVFIAPLLMVLFAPAGCDGTEELPEPDGLVEDLAPCGFAAPPAALIEVSQSYDIFHSGVSTRIGGQVQDGPYPVFHETFLQEGSCRYVKVAYGDCDPPCGAGEVCVAGDTCAPYPTGLSGGTLTIQGLGDDIAIEPEDWSPGTYFGPAGLPANLFDETDIVGATLQGDGFPAVSLVARGVALIDADLVQTGFTVVDGEDAEITWTAGPDPDACVRVVLNGFNQAHGAPLADIIECEGPDTGSLIIPQALVEAFPPGTTPEVSNNYDWPHSELTRYTRSVQLVDEGPAELMVHSTALFLLDHPGEE
ncbi:MAG: hypothetical protein ABH877_05255 [bacterium]